ncbi:MAG: rane protein [Sphingomonas bacterium]|nr:rane protein [Sphingomonas bacterium]
MDGLGSKIPIIDNAKTPLVTVPDIAGLEPMETLKRRWPMVIGAIITIAMITGLGRELFGSGLAGLGRAVPRNPLFYVAFALLYIGPPLGDYIIFRRLWGIPLSGLAALLKKRIANDVVLGYSGEAYFYAWARQRSQMVAAPFGAVKDVSILSAIAGNAITLAMLAIAVPFGKDLLTPTQLSTVETSAAITFAMSLPFLIFSKRVFSLPRGTLWWIFGVHCVRLVSGSIFIAFAWHYALPTVSIGMWLILAAARLLVSRLPLVPNKDLLFANFAILLIGQDAALSELMAMTAAFVLLVHVILIGSFSLHGLLRTKNVVE